MIQVGRTRSNMLLYRPVAVVFHTADDRKANRERKAAAMLVVLGLTRTLAITPG